MNIISAFILGFTIPFILLAVFYGQLFKHLDKFKAHMGHIKKIGGIVLIAAGVLMSINAGREILNLQGTMPESTTEQVVEDIESPQNLGADEQIEEDNSSQEGQDDRIKLGIVNPKLGREGDQSVIENFLEVNNYTFPVMFDTNYSLMYQYGLSAFPSTLIIDDEGYIKVYVPGAMDKATMKKIIDEA